MPRLSAAIVLGSAACAGHPTIPSVPVQTPLCASGAPSPSGDSAAPEAASAGVSVPAAPFDTLPTSQLTAYRLQNYAPPAWTPTSNADVPAQPGVGADRSPWALQNSWPRFPDHPNGYRILGQTLVTDRELKESLAELLGDPNNFQQEHANCMYPELGLSFVGGQLPPNEVLVSFACSRVVAVGGFVWPHPSEGMTPELTRRLAQIAGRLFPPST